MSISLKNHEDRITALEKKVQSTVASFEKWTDGDTYWIRERSTGLIIQFGTLICNSQWQQVVMPIAFSNTKYKIVENYIIGGLDQGSVYSARIDTTQKFTTAGYRGYHLHWLAIGF